MKTTNEFPPKDKDESIDCPEYGSKSINDQECPDCGCDL